MPVDANFAQPIVIDSSGVGARSVRYWAYPSSQDRSVEVPIGQARYIEWRFFSARNQAGTDMGLASWDGGDHTATQVFGGMTVDQIIAYVYPPPGTDT